jgi:hypothetical protein
MYESPLLSCQWNRNNTEFVLMCRPTVQNTVQVILPERISVQVIKYYWNEISSVLILGIVWVYVLLFEHLNSTRVD